MFVNERKALRAQIFWEFFVEKFHESYRNSCNGDKEFDNGFERNAESSRPIVGNRDEGVLAPRIFCGAL